MIKKAGNLLLLLFVVVSGLVACTQQRSPCYEPTIVYAAMGSYRLVDTSSVDTFLPNPIIGSIDSPYLKSQPEPRNRFSVIFSPFRDSMRYYLQGDIISDSTTYTIEQVDTLTFYYASELTFISNACGYTYYYTINDIKTTHNSIDSISIIDRNVDNNVNTQHVKIYY